MREMRMAADCRRGRVVPECTHINSGRHRRGWVGCTAIGSGSNMYGGGIIRDQTIAVNWPCPGGSRELRRWLKVARFQSYREKSQFFQITATFVHSHTLLKAPPHPFTPSSRRESLFHDRRQLLL